MQRFAKFKEILGRRFIATLNFQNEKTFNCANFEIKVLKAEIKGVFSRS